MGRRWMEAVPEQARAIGTVVEIEYIGAKASCLAYTCLKPYWDYTQ